MKRIVLRIFVPMAALSLLVAAPGAQVDAQPGDQASDQAAVVVGDPVSGQMSKGAALIPPMLFGWAHVGPGAPVTDAKVRIVTRRGDATEVPAVRTGLNGEFAFDLKGASLPRVVVVETRGGTVAGQPWRGRLRSMIVLDSQRHSVHLNAATTISTAWRLANRSGASRTQHEAHRRVRIVLGLDPHLSIDAGMRLGTTPLDGMRIARAIERRGEMRWLRSKLRLMDVQQQGPIYDSGVRSGRITGGLAEATVQPAGIGGVIGSLVWDEVESAAKSCSGSGSSIPGVGYLASGLNDFGLITQDPACSQLQEVLNELDAIQQGITQIETALQETSDQVQKIAIQVALNALSNGRSNLQYNVLSPITYGQQTYTYLIDASQTTVAQLGMSLGDILNSTDDSVVSHPAVVNLRSQAANALGSAGALGTSFETAVTSLMAPGIISDDMGGADKGILRLTWEAIVPPTFPSFISASDLASYNNVVTFMRQINSHAAALMIDISRNRNLTSAQIEVDILGPWQLPDTYFDGVSTELLPCPSVDDTLNGYCYPLTVRDAAGTEVDWDVRAPVIDPVGKLLWASVCATDVRPSPGPRTAVPIGDCDVSGIVSYTMQGSTPRWFEIPVAISWNGNVGGSFTRPSTAQVETLKARAEANSQQPPAMNGWLATQDAVFAEVAAAPIATSGIAGDCGWGTTNRPDLDYLGTFYYACDIPDWCYANWATGCQKVNRIGLQHTAFVAGLDVAGRSSRIGWATTQNVLETYLSSSLIPVSPPTAYKGSVYETDNTGVAPSTMARIIAVPPTQSQAPMAGKVAPLVVRPFDTSGYVLSGDAWSN